jgi:hypothetical protein
MNKNVQHLKISQNPFVRHQYYRDKNEKAARFQAARSI